MTNKIVTESFGFIARFHVKPDRRDELRSLFDTLWDDAPADIEAHANFLYFGWSRQENVFVSIESWKSLEAVGQIRSKRSFEQLVTRMLECCNRPMTIEMFSGASTDGSIFGIFPAGPSPHHPTVDGIGVEIL